MKFQNAAETHRLCKVESNRISKSIGRMSRFLRLIVFLQVRHSLPSVLAWDQCPDEKGGGKCPDGTTCCSAEFKGMSACVPVSSNLLYANETGVCCGDSVTGCPFGYECVTSIHQSESTEMLCMPTNDTMQNDPWAREAPRYKLCRVPKSMQGLLGFPILASSEYVSVHNRSDNENRSNDIFNLGYYSSHGSITANEKMHALIHTAVIIIHGSLRDADDYFCTGLSLLQGPDTEIDIDRNVLVLAPWFASVNDEYPHVSNATTPQMLVWDDVVRADDSFYWHTWRYGANANNAPISSFDALDKILEYLVSSNDQFPNLERISLVGHSGTYFFSIVHVTGMTVEARLTKVSCVESSWRPIGPSFCTSFR